MSELYVMFIKYDLWTKLTFFFGILSIACFATAWYLETRYREHQRVAMKREIVKAYEKGYKDGFWFGTDRE